MKKLIICLLITLTGLLGQNALAKDVTIAKPSSSGHVTVTVDGETLKATELTEKELSDYLKICGAVENSSAINGWTIGDTNPTDGKTVYFVEVNDFWIGMNNSSESNTYTEVSKGVKKITKVQEDASQGTSTGTFYTHPATGVNKFFFIKGRSERKSTKNRAFNWYDEWSYVTDSDVNGSDGWDALEPTWEQLMDGTPFPSPHNCDTSLETNHYTALDGKSPADSKGHDFTAYLYIPTKHADGSKPDVTYENLPGNFTSNGKTYYIYSKYVNRSYSTNYLTSVYVKVGDEYKSLAAEYPDMYYKTNGNTSGYIETVEGYKAGSTKKVVKAGECPYVFFYAVGLNGALGAKQTSEQYNPYTVNLDWSTAFDKFATNGVQKHASYDGGGDAAKGMQEHYLVERSYNNTKWETVTDQIVVKGNDVKEKTNKKTVDNQLQAFNETTQLIGYTVYYRVTSYVEKSDGTKMSETTSNTVRVDIPGTVPFKLTLAGEGSSVYNPADVTLNNVIVDGNAYVGPTNSFTNTIISAASTVEEADKVELTDDAVLYLYAVDAKGNTYGEPLCTAKNPTGNKSLDVLAKLIDNTPGDDKEGYFHDTMELPAGDSNAAAYQLKLVTGGTQTLSNILRINNTAIGMDETVKAHRSGTPDEATCAKQETFHNEIKFLASTKQVGTGYYIYKDAKSSNPTDPSNYWKKLIYSTDSQGKEGFREDGKTNYYYPDVNGYLTITDIFESAPIAVGEEGATGSQANVYSVAFYDGKGNTYGSPRGDALYEGYQDELTLSVSATLRAANFRPADNYNVHVNIFVNWNATMAGKYNDVNPQSVTVWLKNKNEDALPLDEVVESSMAPMAMATEYSFVGQTEYKHEVTAEGDVRGTITIPHIYKSKWQSENGKKYTADALLQSLTGAETIEEGQKLETDKYEVYVKMTTTSGAVKNSFVAIPQVEAGAIYTGIEGIEAADMDVKVVNGVVEVSGVTGVIKVVNTIGAVVAEAEGNGEVAEIEGLSSGVYVVTAKNMKPTKILIK